MLQFAASPLRTYELSDLVLLVGATSCRRTKPDAPIVIGHVGSLTLNTGKTRETRLCLVRASMYVSGARHTR
jgi:hypothetical protein